MSSLITDHIIDNAHIFNSAHSRIVCPECDPNRKKQGEKTLSVTVDDDGAVYMCHHCGVSGNVTNSVMTTPIPDAGPPVVVTPSDPRHRLDENQTAYLASRGIQKSTAEEFGLINDHVWIRSRKKNVACIGFPYENLDGTKAVKWRDGSKNFSQTGTAKTLWGIDKLYVTNPDGSTSDSPYDLVITEGEIDVLSFYEAGVKAVSVPNGAPSKLSESADSNSVKYAFLWDAKDVIDGASKIIIATDSDEPGKILSEEIARRIGRAKCWSVRFPDGCKDANDVLKAHGPDVLRQVVKDATPWPVGGLRNVNEYRSEAIDLYRSGMTKGIDVTVGQLGKIYRPCTGTFTICTGIPSSGKSTFLTWLSVHLATYYGWTAAVFSAETSSQVHLLNVASIRTQKPFRGPGKMSEEELCDAIEWASDKFYFLDESETSIDSVLDRAHAAILRHGVKLVVIDPYNWLTGNEDGSQAETYNINKMLRRLKSFATEHDVAVWLVAHPYKMHREGKKIPIPTGYDISGSAHFFNVADNGLTVSRMDDGIARITSWKSRFPWLGDQGYVEMGFDPSSLSFGTHIDFEWDDDESEVAGMKMEWEKDLVI